MNSNTSQADKPGESEEKAAEQLKAGVKAAVESQEDIREKVRRLTVEALAEGKLEAEQVKAIIESVIQGASLGIETHGNRARQALEEAVKGLEDGLIKAAEASKLALEEAASRADEFTAQEVKRAFEQLVELEKLYLDTLAEVAKKGSAQAGEILADLVRHARDSGTAVGEYLAEVMQTLPRKLQEAGQWGFKAGLDAARTTGAQLAAIASGFLAGIAEALDRQTQKSKSQKPDQG
jgi:polyhydroxyalkanoate synthesis regulator phasin